MQLELSYGDKMGEREMEDIQGFPTFIQDGCITKKADNQHGSVGVGAQLDLIDLVM